MRLALKATGSVLLHLQWDGSTEQRKLGLSVRTSSPAWSARTSTTFLLSGLDLRGPGVAIAPLLSPILLQGKDVEGGVNRLVVGGSTGICITTAWVSATWLGCFRGAGLLERNAFLSVSFSPQTWQLSGVHCERKRMEARARSRSYTLSETLHWTGSGYIIYAGGVCPENIWKSFSNFGKCRLQSFSQLWTWVKRALLSVAHFEPLLSRCRQHHRLLQLSLWTQVNESPSIFLCQSAKICWQ